MLHQKSQDQLSPKVEPPQENIESNALQVEKKYDGKDEIDEQLKEVNHNIKYDNSFLGISFDVQRSSHITPADLHTVNTENERLKIYSLFEYFQTIDCASKPRIQTSLSQLMALKADLQTLTCNCLGAIGPVDQIITILQEFFELENINDVLRTQLKSLDIISGVQAIRCQDKVIFIRVIETAQFYKPEEISIESFYARLIMDIVPQVYVLLPSKFRLFNKTPDDINPSQLGSHILSKCSSNRCSKLDVMELNPKEKRNIDGFRSLQGTRTFYRINKCLSYQQKQIDKIQVSSKDLDLSYLLMNSVKKMRYLDLKNHIMNEWKPENKMFDLKLTYSFAARVKKIFRVFVKRSKLEKFDQELSDLESAYWKKLKIISSHSSSRIIPKMTDETGSESKMTRENLVFAYKKRFFEICDDMTTLNKIIFSTEVEMSIGHIKLYNVGRGKRIWKFKMSPVTLEINWSCCDKRQNCEGVSAYLLSSCRGFCVASFSSGAKKLFYFNVSHAKSAIKLCKFEGEFVYSPSGLCIVYENSKKSFRVGKLDESKLRIEWQDLPVYQKATAEKFSIQSIASIAFVQSSDSFLILDSNSNLFSFDFKKSTVDLAVPSAEEIYPRGYTQAHCFDRFFKSFYKHMEFLEIHSIIVLFAKSNVDFFDLDYQLLYSFDSRNTVVFPKVFYVDGSIFLFAVYEREQKLYQMVEVGSFVQLKWIQGSRDRVQEGFYSIMDVIAECTLKYGGQQKIERKSPIKLIISSEQIIIDKPSIQNYCGALNDPDLSLEFANSAEERLKWNHSIPDCSPSEIISKVLKSVPFVLDPTISLSLTASIQSKQNNKQTPSLLSLIDFEVSKIDINMTNNQISINDLDGLLDTISDPISVITICGSSQEAVQDILAESFKTRFAFAYLNTCEDDIVVSIARLRADDSGEWKTCLVFQCSDLIADSSNSKRKNDLLNVLVAISDIFVVAWDISNDNYWHKLINQIKHRKQDSNSQWYAGALSIIIQTEDSKTSEVIVNHLKTKIVNLIKNFSSSFLDCFNQQVSIHSIKTRENIRLPQQCKHLHQIFASQLGEARWQNGSHFYSEFLELCAQRMNEVSQSINSDAFY